MMFELGVGASPGHRASMATLASFNGFLRLTGG
jgi:hypothetical protein